MTLKPRKGDLRESIALLPPEACAFGTCFFGNQSPFALEPCLANFHSRSSFW